MLRSLGILYTLGRPIDWSLQGGGGRFARIPTYPWQRERHWHESEESRDSRLGMKDAHPLLGRAESSGPGVVEQPRPELDALPPRS